MFEDRIVYFLVVLRGGRKMFIFWVCWFGVLRDMLNFFRLQVNVEFRFVYSVRKVMVWWKWEWFEIRKQLLLLLLFIGCFIEGYIFQFVQIYFFLFVKLENEQIIFLFVFDFDIRRFINMKYLKSQNLYFERFYIKVFIKMNFYSNIFGKNFWQLYLR